MDTIPYQIRQRSVLDIEDALVTDENPARDVDGLDYERCARLHNYLVAYRWMARHGRGTPDLDEMANERNRSSTWHAHQEEQRQYLHPSLNRFFDLVIPDAHSFFYWVEGHEIRIVDDDFMEEENDLEHLARFVVIYAAEAAFGSHPLGLVYDQENHAAAIPLAMEKVDSVGPIDEHSDMWYPLETILSHWIKMVHMGKVVPRDDEAMVTGSQVGSWTWLSYCSEQVDNTVSAIDRYTAAIEVRMSPSSLLPLSRETPLFNNADLDAADVPEECFIRSVLTKMKTPRFKAIAPGLEVPHDTATFITNQKFPGTPRDHESWGRNIPPVLIFPSTIAGSTRSVEFNNELRGRFFGRDDSVPFTDKDRIPTGLYSESVRRGLLGNEEAGFRLVLPFALRPEPQHSNGARMSDGKELTPGSLAELFQHGTYHPFGGERRAQRLERLIEHWTELVDSGTWAVGNEGVEGTIDKFQDSTHGAWEDYWIAPWW